MSSVQSAVARKGPRNKRRAGAPAQKPKAVLIKRQGEGRSRAQKRVQGLKMDSLDKIASQLCLPGSVESPAVLPNSAPAQVCARYFRRVVTVKKADFPQLKILMSPDLYNPGFIGGGTAISVPAAGSGPMTIKGNLVCTTANTPDNTTSERFDVASAVNKGVVLGSAIADTTPVIRWGINGVWENNKPLLATVANKSKQNCGLEIATKVTGGAWVVTTVPNLSVNARVTIAIPIPAGANTTTIAFSIINTGGKQCTMNVDIGCPNAQVTSAGTISYAPAFADQIIDDNVTTGRVVAMSILAQNTSADLIASGNIHSARVPNNFNLSGNVIEEMSTLPDNRRYAGKFKKGTFVTWLPSQLEEMEIDNVHQMADRYSQSEYLVVEVPDWVDGSSMQLTFVWSVEFYSPSMIFEKRVTPPRTREFEALMFALLLMHAAGCNPSHLDYARDYIKRVEATLRSAYTYYQEHKAVFDTAASAISAAVALL